jgi:sugar/nucleoside kinase (ribokinase family)
MKKYNTIVVGELNVDIILNHIERFPEIGKEILAGSLDLTLGSSSAILASNLSSLGSSVAFIGKIGKDGFASTVLDSLSAKKVDTSKIIQSETLNTGATVVLNFDQDRANTTYPGAMEDLKYNDLEWDFIREADHLHFSSAFLQPGIKNDLPKMFQKARDLGLTTSLDPQWDPAEKWDINLQDLLPHLNVFMPNVTELLLITGTSSLEEGIEKVKQYAPDIILIIKDGANGAYAWNDNKLTHQPAFLNEKVVDCIGAGDSFNAGFLHKFTQGGSLSECLKYGALTGAVSTTKAGGTGAFANIETIRAIAAEQFSSSI